MYLRIPFSIFSAALLLCVAARAETRVDDQGRLQRLAVGKGWLDLQSDIRIPLKGWGTILSFSSAQAKPTESGNKRIWRATLGENKAQSFEVTQAVTIANERILFDISIKALEDVEIEGAMFGIDLPTSTFAGGIYAAGSELGDLPKQLPDPYHLCNITGNTLAFADATHQAKVRTEFDRATGIVVQDSRKFNIDQFNAFIWIQNGNIAKNQSVALRIAMAGGGNVDEAPAHLSIDPRATLGRVWGNGGSYCFSENTPVAEYTFRNLNVAISRVEMSLRDWEPENDNDDPAKTNWQKLKEHDKAGSNLHSHFEMMRQLSRKRIPFIISIWYLPKWMYVDPEETEFNNKIAQDKWPELLESIGTYLLYAKEKYFAEPDYFSFNEPDLGVHVGFTAEEYRDAIKRIGAHLAKLKLKTKILLGDVANPRGTQDYCLTAAKDPEAMKYVGALSFHSWGGAHPDQYAEWPALAKKLKLPLICAEAGPDPDWNTQPFFKPEAHVAEMAHYIEIFRDAQPQAVIYWEFSDNFPLLKHVPESQKLIATERLGLQKHFCDLALIGGEGIEAASDNNSILIAAFKRKGRKDADDFTIHVGNTKWPRHVTLDGIPEKIKVLEAVCTAPGEIFKRVQAVRVIDGKVELELPAQSLTTLTTLEIPELKLP